MGRKITKLLIRSGTEGVTATSPTWEEHSDGILYGLSQQTVKSKHPVRFHLLLLQHLLHLDEEQTYSPLKKNQVKKAELNRKSSEATYGILKAKQHRLQVV